MANKVNNQARSLFLQGAISGLSDTFRVILMEQDYIFDEDNDDTYALIGSSELANGDGYTTGGQVLTNAAISVSDSDNTATLSWDDPSWTLIGDSDRTIRGALVFNDSMVSPVIDPIILWIDFGDNITVHPGSVLTIPEVSITI